jgi:ABC-type transport system substrate-binding protein
MKKIILVGLAILAVSTSGALAAKKATKPKAPAAAATTTTTTTTTTNPGGAAPFMLGQVSASDRELYEKSQRESGMKK